MWKFETLTVCKIDTLEQIITKFVKNDYIDERDVYSEFVKINPRGNSRQTGEYNFCDYLFIYFLDET